ncbi:MAG: FtsW/RodA/SpoVE family cell cycle protein, partial [Ignavibacteria bacterium]|nr:FtsW/RodA/SpoVE family cell cycle protein [Ignavibacteria bacterium]
ARRVFGFQTSDFARLALIIYLSALIAKKGDEITNLKYGFLPVLFWIFICAGLIMLQPNFSTAFIFIVIGFSMLFVGGAQIKHIFNTVLVSLPLLVAYLFSASYRYNRIFDYASIISGNVTVKKQAIYSIRALGNGGIWGVGIGSSSQRDLFLPEAYGDFIFSVIGEEYGFIGVTIVLGVYLLILWRGFNIARNATDKFSQLLAFGITFSFSLYALINAGVSCGLFPATGIPMPFLSYGGTAILFNAIGIGILLNLSTYINSPETKLNYLALSNE